MYQSFTEIQTNGKYWKKTYCPHIIKNSKGKPLNVWSAACSTGEEPYSFSNAFNQVL